MTKKDYIKFAKMLNEWNQAGVGGIEFPFNKLVADIADVLASDNERFDYERFREAVYKVKSSGEWFL